MRSGSRIGGIEESRQTDAPAALSTDAPEAAPPGEAGAAPARRPSVDDMGEWSFPASDPPATWTWEPRSP